MEVAEEVVAIDERRVTSGGPTKGLGRMDFPFWAGLVKLSP
jgi:hypothetical protein